MNTDFSPDDTPHEQHHEPTETVVATEAPPPVVELPTLEEASSSSSSATTAETAPLLNQKPASKMAFLPRQSRTKSPFSFQPVINDDTANPSLNTPPSPWLEGALVRLGRWINKQYRYWQLQGLGVSTPPKLGWFSLPTLAVCITVLAYAQGQHVTLANWMLPLLPHLPHGWLPPQESSISIGLLFPLLSLTACVVGVRLMLLAVAVLVLLTLCGVNVLLLGKPWLTWHTYEPIVLLGMMLATCWMSQHWQQQLPKLGTRSLKLTSIAFSLALQGVGLMGFALLLGGAWQLVTQQLSWVWFKQFCLYNVVVLYPWLIAMATVSLLLARPLRFILFRWWY